MGDYSSLYKYEKFEVVGDELISLGIFSVDGDGTMPIVVKDDCDPQCGCLEPIYRWIQTEDTVCIEVVQRQTSGTPYCVGYDKYVVVTVEESFDSGTTWEFVSSSSTLVEADSPDCGYVPPTPSSAKFRLTLSDSTTVSAECDSTSSVTSGEVSSQYSGTVVSAEIGNCVTNIGERSFYKCSGLTSIVFPNSVTSIGDSAFEQCYYLQNITIPNSVTSIGNRAFQYCLSLSDITIPDSVTNIGQYAFDTCNRATGITIGNGVTTIGYASFLGCSSATTLSIGNNVTTIGDFAFTNCEALTSITIPDSVITIGEDAFNAALYATSLTIGSGVTYIGEDAFMNCARLQSITIYATTPPTLAYEYEFYASNCPIYVPAGSVNAYKTATNWSEYASRIQAIP